MRDPGRVTNDERRTTSQVTLVYGSEAWLRQREIESLRNKLIPKEARVFDETRLTAGEGALQRVREALQTQAVSSSGGRFVWMTGCERLRARDIKELEGYLALGRPANHLLLEAGVLRADHALIKMMKSQGAQHVGRVVRCAPLTGQQLTHWVARSLRDAQVLYEASVPAFLIDRLTGNLSDIAKAIDRIALFVQGRKTRVTIDVVSRLVPADRVGAVFELAEAFGRKDAAAALRRIHEMLRMGRQIPEIIGLLFWQLKQIGSVLDFYPVAMKQQISTHGNGVNGTMSARDLARALGRHPYYVERLMQQAKRFTRAEVRRDLDLIAHADLATKTSGMKARLRLELLVLRLCGLEAV